MRKSTRLGFKLIELVLVIGIIAVIAALTIPAVLKVRAAVARTQTNNNLRQCAIAVHNYHGVYNKFPNAAWHGVHERPDTPRSMWFHLLPFVEQKAVYDNNVHNAVVSAYLAPSDPSLNDPAGRICFAGNIRLFGYNTLTATLANSAVGREGQRCEPSGLSLRDHLTAAMSSGLTLARIPDGTSNTFMLATRYAACGSPLQSTYYSGSPIGTVLAAGGMKPSTGVPSGNVKGAFFGAGSHDHEPDVISHNAMFQLDPTLELCLPDDSVFGHSFSPVGLSTALADASIKNVEPNTPPAIFCLMLCPSDGCPIGNDWPDQ
jgi:type II secretory pathway pseudopilin PulG